MSNDISISKQKSDFAILCKKYRQQHRLKLREVASIIGVVTSTYGNVESSSHKVISDDKAAALADHYKLAGDERQAFMAASAACPLSTYSQKQRDQWKRQNERRSRAKLSYRLEAAACGLLGLLFLNCPDPDKLCACDFDGSACELCAALAAIGFPPGKYTNDREVSDWVCRRQEMLSLEGVGRQQ